MVVYGCCKLPSLIGGTFDPFKVPSEVLKNGLGLGDCNNRKGKEEGSKKKGGKSRGRSQSRKKKD